MRFHSDWLNRAAYNIGRSVEFLAV